MILWNPEDHPLAFEMTSGIRTSSELSQEQSFKTGVLCAHSMRGFFGSINLLKIAWISNCNSDCNLLNALF